MKISILSRILYFLTAILASYEIINGMDNYSNLITTLYTISFGLLLLASLLLLIMGFEIMNNNYIAVLTSLIPITLSLGLVIHKLEHFTLYAILISLGFIIASILRFFSKGKTALLSLGVIHFISGIVIFLLPIILFLLEKSTAQILFISLGGLIIGIGGILLGFIKAEKEILSKKKLEAFFPIILFSTTFAFIIGLSA